MLNSFETSKGVNHNNHNSSWITTSDSSEHEEKEKHRRSKKSIANKSKLREKKVSTKSNKKIVESEVINQDVTNKKKYYVDGESWDEFDPRICSSEGVPVPLEVPGNKHSKQPEQEITQWETDETESTTYSSTEEDLDTTEGTHQTCGKEKATSENLKQKVPLKSCLKKGEGDQARYSAEIDEMLDPIKFGYVSLTEKVLKDFNSRTRQRKKRRSIRLMDQYGSPLKSTYRSELIDGGDLDVAPPSLLLQGTEDEEDPLGIRTIKDILDSKEMTISQKYRSLGVTEDPWEEDCPEDSQSGCWQWFLYKLNKLYYSQWPSVQHEINGD